LALEMMQYMYQNHPQTWGPYGFFDAYNLDVSPGWYSHSIYGINKGCSMLMIENYMSGLIWNIYTNSTYIQKSLDILGFTLTPSLEQREVEAKTSAQRNILQPVKVGFAT
jgi:hypothetical protein